VRGFLGALGVAGAAFVLMLFLTRFDWRGSIFGAIGVFIGTWLASLWIKNRDGA
jgi:hypothetical protein